MGAGGRYNTNTQKGNAQPSPNHGGGHTGCGKYQHGGVYSLNGKRYQKRTHRDYTEGKKVYYMKHSKFNHKNKGFGEAVVLSKKNDTIRVPRSMIRIQFKNNDSKVYVHKDSLLILS